MTVGDSMTEPIDPGVVTSTAGAMLKAAREKRGLHIAALAASMSRSISASVNA